MNNTSGYLNLIIGPMFSGKTTRLIQLYRTYKYSGIPCLVINYKGDTRYHDSMLSTHDKTQIKCLNILRLKDVTDDLLSNVQVVLINEGQFFSDLEEIVLDWVESKNKIVHIAALDNTFQRKPWKCIINLIGFADNIEKKKAICYTCKNNIEALFTFRTTKEEEDIVIGSDNYVSLCRKCYLHSTKP